jgi:hypothetical protein
MKASIKLINPKTIVSGKPILHSPQDKEEFSKQIKELLDMRLIKESKSPHMSPAFLVNKEAEKRRGKKHMVVNYKAINDATIRDSHNLPNMHELLTLLWGKIFIQVSTANLGSSKSYLMKNRSYSLLLHVLMGSFNGRYYPLGLNKLLVFFKDTCRTPFEVLKFYVLYTLMTSWSSAKMKKNTMFMLPRFSKPF